MGTTYIGVVSSEVHGADGQTVLFIGKEKQDLLSRWIDRLFPAPPKVIIDIAVESFEEKKLGSERYEIFWGKDLYYRSVDGEIQKLGFSEYNKHLPVLEDAVNAVFPM